MSDKELNQSYHEALNFRDPKNNIIGPNLVIDDGCDITRFIHQHRPELIESIIGITEQTTCGINELKVMSKEQKLKLPAINVNDAKTKLEFDNYYGVQQSLLSGLDNATNYQLRGKNVLIAGFGPVGKGACEILHQIGCKIYVSEIDPFRAMQAHMTGYTVSNMYEASKICNIF